MWPLLRGLALCCGFVAASAQQPQYIGAGGCSSSNCHGGTRALSEAESRILGNEYSLWSVRDKHAKAFNVLANDRSKRMAQILNISDAQKAQRCLSCHAVGSPARSISDGVACEACHGPAEKWLGPHTQPKSHAASVAAGMLDTKDPQVRARNCLSCHLGTKDRVVDHELIAAGHPDLVFELDTFTAAQPMHHREPKPSEGNSLPRVRIWAIGQAVALGDGMRLLAMRARSGWPEFAEFECYQCHHDLRAESWRIQRGYAGRKPGSLQINMSRFQVLHAVLAQSAPDQAPALDAAVAQLGKISSSSFQDGAAMAQAADSVARHADALAARFAKQNFEPAGARAMVKALAAQASQWAGSGVHSAEQATMSLDALAAAAAANPAAFQVSIAKLYDYLEHPSTYQPSEFAALFRKVAGQVE